MVRVNENGVVEVPESEAKGLLSCAVWSEVPFDGDQAKTVSAKPASNKVEMTVKKMAKKLAQKAAKRAVKEEPLVDDSMTKAELFKVAARRGVYVPKKAVKTAIIRLLNRKRKRS
jgi:hypothetical protein